MIPFRGTKHNYEVWQSCLTTVESRARLVLKHFGEHTLGKHANHLAAVFRGKRRGGQGFGGSGREFGNLIGQGVARRAAVQNIRNSLHPHGRRIQGCDPDAQVAYMAVAPLAGDGDSGQRVVDRSANAQLAIGSAEAGRRTWEKDARNDFIRPQSAVGIAFASVELAERNATRTGGPGYFDIRIQAKQSRRGIAGERRPAFAAAGSDVAEIAVLLDAESARLSPGKRLVVPQAARIEADVTADRAHVADDRSGYVTRRLDEHGIVLPEMARCFDFTQCGQRADFSSLIRLTNALDPWNQAQVDHTFRLEQFLA